MTDENGCDICVIKGQVLSEVSTDTSTFREHDTVRGVFCRVTVSASDRCKSDIKLRFIEEGKP